MGRAGKLIEPIVSPLGWDARMGTAMLTSLHSSGRSLAPRLLRLRPPVPAHHRRRQT